VEELAPLRHQRILEADADGAAAAESERNYAAWKMEREALLAKASEPSLLVQTVTSLVRSAAGRASARNERRAPRGCSRPLMALRAVRFSIAVGGKADMSEPATRPRP